MNLAVSFNAWLKNERRHSICNVLIKHIAKLGAMLVRHKAESNEWKGTMGLKMDAKVRNTIGEVLSVSSYMTTLYDVFSNDAIVNVDILERTCGCRSWQMLGIPCKHACVVILYLGQNATDFVEDISYPKVGILG